MCNENTSSKNLFVSTFINNYHVDDFVQDILTEILSEQEWGVVDWVEVWRCWVSSSLDTCHSAWSEDMGPGHVTRSIQLSSQVSNMTAHPYYYYSGLGYKHCH